MRFERTDKGLMVYDFDMASHLLKSDRNELKAHIGPDYFKDAIVVDKMRRAKGKKPAVFMNHTDKPDSRIIGTIEEMRYTNNKLYGDIFIEDTWLDAKGVRISDRFESGKIQERSIEFNPDSPFIAGVALLDEAEGHFSEELVSVSAGKYENLHAGEDLGKINLVSLKVAKVIEDKLNMSEDLKAVLEQLKALNTRIDSIEKSDTKEYDPFEENSVKNAQVQEQAQVLALEQSLKTSTEMWVLRLEKSGSSLTAKQIRKKLAVAKTLKDLEYEGQLLELRSRNGVKLEADPEESSPETILRSEYEGGKAKGKFVTLSFDDYKNINKEFVK